MTLIIFWEVNINVYQNRRHAKERDVKEKAHANHALYPSALTCCWCNKLHFDSVKQWLQQVGLKKNGLEREKQQSGFFI